MSIAEPVVRVAPAAFALHDALGRPTVAGEGDAVVSDDGLTVGPVSVAWLDADGLVAGEHAMVLELWPAGRLVLSQLGRRFESFHAAVVSARNRARVVGMLAHGIVAPSIYDGAVLEPGAERLAELLLYDTHLTVVPEQDDPFQVPYGTIVDCRIEGPGRVICTAAGGQVRLGQLGRQGDAFLQELLERRSALHRRIVEATGTPALIDGMGVPRPELPQFDRLVADFTAPERREHARLVLAAVRGGEPRFGVVTLLDPDGETHVPPRTLPPHTASFLLAPCGDRVVFELLSGPSAATYVFAGEIGPINRDLQALHFRRSSLAVSDDEAVRVGHPHRLAFRRLEPLRRLRAATVARIIHDANWRDCLDAAVGRPG